MQEAVSTILIDRARAADGLSRTVLVSFAVHATVIAVVVLMPDSWRRPSVEREITPMMITLGAGARGPDSGGMTPIPGRAVQQVAPPQAKPAPQAPPAPKAPEMVLPTTKTAPKTPPKAVSKPLEKSASRKPTVGPEIKSGASAVDTGGAAIRFGGLSSGGAAGSGLTTDYANFCCPEYLQEMSSFIERNWERDQGAAGRVQMKFTIRRDGMIEGIEVEKPSNIAMLDLASQRALVKTRQLPPLPREFTENKLTVHLIFEYQH